MRKLGWGLVIGPGIVLAMSLPIFLGSFSLDGGFYPLERHIYGWIFWFVLLVVGLIILFKTKKRVET